MNRTRCLLVGGAATLFVGFALVDAPRFAPNSPGAPGVGKAWWSEVQSGIARAEYRPAPIDGGLRTPNRAQHLQIDFREESVQVVPQTESTEASAPWSCSWQTTRWGRVGRLETLTPANVAPQVDGTRIVYARRGLDEWYENDAQGLEQGFTIHERLPGNEPLILEGRFGGGLRPALGPDGDAIDLIDERGAHALRYGELHVRDAAGNAIPSRLELDGTAVALVVDDKGARYPLTIDPLLTSPSWTVEADQLGALLGCSVAPAGDVNGDGFSDVIVAASGFNAGGGHFGATFVYHGSAAGLATTPAWTAVGDSLSMSFGNCAAPAGDVNGDGYADVIVAAYLASNGQANEGRVFVFHGSPSGLGATPAWSAESDQSGASFGVSAATAGDVNGDGYDDVIVGATQFNGDQVDEGRAFVYHGSATGLAATPAWTAESNQSNSAYGISVSTAGDINGDGYADVVVGAERFTFPQSQEGRAYVYLGSASGLNGGATFTVESNQPLAIFGHSVSTAGDTNGDGYCDIIVGAWGATNGQASEGRAYLFRGSAAGLVTTPSWTAESDQANALFGWSVGTAGDVNGDGFADVIVGANRYDNGEVDEGRAYIYYGSNVGPTTPRWTAESNQADAFFGISVATAGDVNGDGYSDVLVGAQLFDNGQSDEGRAFVYHGSSDGAEPFPFWAAEGNQALAGFGTTVASAGDVNGDGFSDLLVTAYGFDNGQFDEGRAFVYHGSAIGPSFIENWTTESNQNSAFLGFGTGAAGAGDVNGDGFSDVILGAPFYDGGQSDEGRVVVHIGSPTGLQTPAWATLEANQADAHFGISVASAGDVNGDGFGDVIIGAEQAANPEFWEGRAYVYHGGPSGLVLAWTAEPNQESAKFGSSVASAGDVNGDGYSDVIVGAPSYDGGQTDEGRALVYLGSPTGLAATPAWTAESNQAGAEFGSSVACAGDVNGDGYSDVIVGADLYDNGQGNEGQASIYLGSAAGLAATPAWAVESNQIIAGVGMSVASAGDVNNDGFSDVIVGFRQYTSGATNEGIAFVYNGGATGPDAIADMSNVAGQANAFLGCSVASAGDVNGDGFSDVVIGSLAFDNGATNEGRAQVHMGNNMEGLDRIPRQARADGSGTPIALLGHSDSEDSFRARALGRTAMGRGRVRLEVEAKPLGTAFDGGDLVKGPATNTGPVVSGSSAVALQQLVGGLVPDSPYHWRARIASDSPFQPYSPWLSPPGNAPSETDLNSRDAFPRQVFITDASAVEGNAGTSQIVLTVSIDPSPLAVVSVDFTTVDGTATVAGGDYEATSGTLTFQPGQASAPIAVTIHGDLEFEFDEWFRVELSNPAGVVLADFEGTGTIVDDADPSNVTICPDFVVTDGQVDAMAERNGVLYIGGTFNEVAPPTGGAVPLDANTAAVLAAPRVEGDVYAVAPDGTGGWYVGGSFSQIAGVARQNIAHLGADHAPTAWNPGADGTVLALAVDGGTVYAAGLFTHIAGQARDRIAALDAATGNATSWNPGADAPVRALAVQGGSVYVGGDFSSVGGGNEGVAALDKTTGIAKNWTGHCNGAVYALVAHGGLLYVGGAFTQLGNATRGNIAALDTTTGLATGWDASANGTVQALALGSGVLYAGGTFSGIGGDARNRIAALDLVTGEATAWTPGVNSTVYAIAVSGNTVYAGGQFTAVGGQTIRRLAAIDATSGLTTAWLPRPTDVVHALAVDGNIVYAGGLFAGAGGTPRRRIAAIDLSTGSVTPWNPDPNGNLSALAVDGDVVYAGGSFTTIGGASRARIAALDPATGLATAWNPGVNGFVLSLRVAGGVVYAGGTFNTFGGAPRNNIGAANASTGVVTAFDPNADDDVRAIEVSDGVVYAGGSFQSIGNQQRMGIAALNASTGLATPWDANPNSDVLSLHAANGVIYAGGYFTAIGSEQRYGLAALDPGTGLATPWNPDVDGGVRAIASTGSTVYAGGEFIEVGHRHVLHLGAVDAATGLPLAWTPTPDFHVHTIAFADGRIYAGGLFQSIGGLARSHLACIQLAGSVVDAPPPPAAGRIALLRMSPNPSSGPARIEYELPQAAHVRISVYDVRGRLVAQPLDEERPAGPSATVWSGEGAHGKVPPGIYFVRITAAGHSATRRLVRLL